MSSQSLTQKTIILGGGLSGLISAAYLEMAGRDYLLLEAQDEFGGLAKGQSEQDVWLDHGMKSIPVGDFETNPLLQIKKDLKLKFAIETVTEPPLTHHKNGFIPFVGFGDSKNRRAIEEMIYYTDSPRFLVSNGWKTLIDELLSLIPEKKRRTRQIVTKIQLTGGRITGVVVNGEDVISGNYFICSFAPKLIASLMPQGALPAKTIQKITKSEPLTAISLDIATKERISDLKNIFVLQDDGFFVTGQFVSNADPLKVSQGLQISSWLTFLNEEEGQDDETVSKSLKTVKKMIKRAFPTLIEKSAWERIIVAPGAIGGATMISHEIENLWVIGSQVSEKSKHVGASLKGAALATSEICKQTHVQDNKGLTNLTF